MGISLFPVDKGKQRRARCCCCCTCQACCSKFPGKNSHCRASAQRHRAGYWRSFLPFLPKSPPRRGDALHCFGAFFARPAATSRLFGCRAITRAFAAQLTAGSRRVNTGPRSRIRYRAPAHYSIRRQCDEHISSCSPAREENARSRFREIARQGVRQSDEWISVSFLPP